MKAKYGVRPLIVVVPHTFGRHLNFNAHLHVMVSAGGLRESGVRWITPLRFNRSKLMHMWRYAVITYLRAALKKGLLVSEASTEDLRVMLEVQYERWWNLYVDLATLGLGFELPSEEAVVGPNGPKIEVGAVHEPAVNY